MTRKEVLNELAAVSERITRLEKSIMSYAAGNDSYAKEHIADIEDALCDISEEDE